MKTMKRSIWGKLKESAGITLVEVMITAAILPFVVGVAYFSLNTAYNNWKISDHKAEALSSSRFLIDRMSKDLRQAERPFVSVDTVDNSYIIFKANINTNAGSEIISYSLKPYTSGGEKVVRSEYDPDMTDPLNPAYPNNPTREETIARIVVNNLVTPKIPLFTFNKADGVPFVTGDDIGDIKMINVDIKVVSSEVPVNEFAADYAQSVQVQNSVKLRNF